MSKNNDDENDKPHVGEMVDISDSRTGDVAEFVLFVVLATVSVPAPVAASAGIGKTNHETAHIHKRALLSKIPLKKYDSNFISC